ncbi:hypothetical protein Vadar_011426 [Vaccinium darrowii]|uniref:Uncharacterized protein n=1 Tax=Vaccinium darrowii TaxID=229202 RepID=A0ACB7YVM5_9ERIC|nr:hypothetical protein Vadar_011426 [Vaccinium darrowii]
MDADERLLALKRAYADIILNTAKEAAARIMVSERKAVGFQYELSVAKEQALQTLLRLKQMMDSKINEAGMTSLSQQKKIEELEAQLEEAEDIVKDVREELREVQAELERVKNSKSQHVDENDNVTKETSQVKKVITSQSMTSPPVDSQLKPFTTSDTKNSAFDRRNEIYDCYRVNDCRIADSHCGKPDLPSTSEMDRVNTLRSILSPHPNSRFESPTASDMKNSASNQRYEVFKGYGYANRFGMGNSNIRKPEVPSVILRSKEPTPYVNRRTQRILAFEEKLMAGELAFSETVNDMNYETNGREEGEDEGISKTSVKKKEVVRGGKGQNQVQKVESFRQKRKRATRYKKIETLSSRNLSNEAVESDRTVSCAETISVNMSTKSCGDPSDMAPKLSADKNGYTEIAERDEQLDKAGSVENLTNKDKASIDELQLTRHEKEFSDSEGAMICRTDVEKVDVPIVNPKTNTSGLNNEIPNQHVTGSRVIKFTFQRKRKRESTVNGNASLGESSPLKKAAGKQNEMLETEKSSSITDPPRDSRCVAQVAHQLVSLSEKKW